MRLKTRTWFVMSLLLFGAGAWMWHYAEGVRERGPEGEGSKADSGVKAPLIRAGGANAVAGRKSYRLSNTRQTVAQLLRNDHAILLRNALIDTSRPLRLAIPAALKSKGAPGSYLVQFDRPLNREFYDAVKRDGGVYVSYIPNNAALVKADGEQGRQLEADPVFQAVLPYEPYYKLDGALLAGAVEGEAQTNLLSVTTYAGQREAALKGLEDLGAQLVGEDQGPFGPTLVVRAPAESVRAIAQMPLAREIEAYGPRRLLNDLTRVQMGVQCDGEFERHGSGQEPSGLQRSRGDGAIAWQRRGAPGRGRARDARGGDHRRQRGGIGHREQCGARLDHPRSGL